MKHSPCRNSRRRTRSRSRFPGPDTACRKPAKCTAPMSWASSGPMTALRVHYSSPWSSSAASESAMHGIATNGLARGDPFVDPLRRPPHGARAQADGGWEVVGPDEAVDRRPGEPGAFHHRADAQHTPVDSLMTVPSIRPIHALARIDQDWIGVIVCHGRYLPVRFLDKSSSGPSRHARAPARNSGDARSANSDSYACHGVECPLPLPFRNGFPR